MRSPPSPPESPIINPVAAFKFFGINSYAITILAVFDPLKARPINKKPATIVIPEVNIITAIQSNAIILKNIKTILLPNLSLKKPPIIVPKELASK